MNIHLIETDKPSRLCIDGKDKLRFAPNYGYNIVDGKVNIHITSDEEIKGGDWYLYKGTAKKKIYLKNNLYYDCKKIILTTDQDLIDDGVQAIGYAFLEWFVENPSCEEVETKLVEFEVDMGLGKDCIEHGSYYKIIIPKTKQEPERGITITYVGKQEMTLVNIETYDTKVYTFKNKEGELYHVIKQDSFLNNLYPEYRFIGPDQKEVADDESINEIKTIMKGWKK